MKSVDVGQVLDEGNWSGYQKLLVLGAALAIVLDGIDNQLLGLALPRLMLEWDLPRKAFTEPYGGVLALSPVGMMIGGAIGGMVGDRVGRRNTLIFSMIAFAVFTLGVSGVHSVAMLGVLRFLAGLALDTLGLFGAFFFGLLGNYVAIFLLPSTLTLAGFSEAAASFATGSWNLGGVAGAIFGAIAIQRLGSRMIMLTMSALAVVCAFVLMKSPIEPSNAVTLMVMFILTGGLVNAVQTTMYALAAHVYPTDIRGTGIGAAVAVGRIGNVLAVAVGTFARDAGGASGYFSTFALTMAATLICLALVRHHIAPTTNWEEMRSAA
jgi:MFS family permease